MTRPKAFFINGGAGRVICSIPAFEKYAENNDDFIIVCEGGTEFYKGHPVLHKHVFDHWHKGLFETHLKHRDIITPEPYRVWEYYNQKCSLAQAFDIIINNEGVRELSDPKIYVNKIEMVSGYNLVQEVREKTGFDKVLVVQPFGRGVQSVGEFIVDPSSRSFHLTDIVEIINELKKEYGVIIMTEFPIALEENDSGKYPVAQPQVPDVRLWASIIETSDHFLGCDSVGQHIAKAVGKTATVVTGSTFPINITYPNSKDFDVIDVGETKRVYSPIRLTMEDELERYNDECMELTPKFKQDILKSVRSRLGKSVKYKGKISSPQQNKDCCPTANAPKFLVDDSGLKPLSMPGAKA